MTAAPLNRDPALRPGQLDRAVLVAAVQFALDSLRAGTVALRGLEDKPGAVDGLVWQQGDWIVPSTWRPAGAMNCGTGCCIAGWITIAAEGVQGATNVMNEHGIREHASTILFGRESSSTMENGRMGFDALEPLFAGGNDINDVFRQADRLLLDCGQPRITVGPNGVLS